MLHHLEAALLTTAYLQKVHAMPRLNRNPEKTKYGTVYTNWSADATV
jgi:hypothetical protein